MLVGSEKQVAWAESIKANFINSLINYTVTLDRFLDQGFNKNQKAVINIAAAKKAIAILKEKIEQQASAKFFIEVVKTWRLETFDFEQTNFGRTDRFFKRVLTYLSNLEAGRPCKENITVEQFIFDSKITIDKTWYGNTNYCDWK